MILSFHNSVYVSLCCFALFVAIPAVAGPKLHCDSPKYDFGTVIGQETIKHEFRLTNRGDEPVKISNIKNCCGVKSSIDPMEILPGSNAVCKSVFTIRNRYGKQDKQILIATNDRRKPYYELKIIGTHKRPVEVEPRFVRLKNLLPNSKIDQTITVTNLLDKAIKLESVESTIAGIKVEHASRFFAEPQRNWSIRLSSSGNLPVGRITGTVKLNFSSGTIKVPVYGTVKSLLQVVPAHIQLSAAATKAARRQVMLRSGDGAPFKVLSAELVYAEGKVEASKLADGRWKCAVEVVPTSIQSGSLLRIKTSCEAQPLVEVPLKKKQTAD